MKKIPSYKTPYVLLVICGMLLSLLPSAYPVGVNSIKGCVVHKGANDGFAVLEEYTSYEVFGTLINFTDQSGKKFRVYHGENPIIIPYASDPEATSAVAGKALAKALESAPHLRQKLDLISKAWTDRSNAEQVARARMASVPKTPPKPLEQKSEIPPLKTKSGEEFRDWNITGINNGKARIEHADGSASILVTDLPLDTLRQHPVIKKAFGEAEGKEANGDLNGALTLYSQLGASADVARIAAKIKDRKLKLEGDAMVKDILDAQRLQQMQALAAIWHRVRVLQVHKDGVLAIVSADHPTKPGALIFITGLQGSVVDNESWEGPLEDDGIYNYTALNGAAKTIRAYRIKGK